MRKQLPKGYELPSNVWLGATVENQDAAGKRLKYLLEFDTPAVRFLSCEPLLGPLDLRQWLKLGEGGTRVDWVIAGGESGPGSRPMDPQWPEDLRKQCNAAGVTGRTPIHIVRRDGSEVKLAAVGKGKAGRSLGGRHWDQFPSPGNTV